jgi:hypothetical protein
MSIAQETPSNRAQGAVQRPDGQAHNHTSDTTALITEREVLFGTAAASGLRRKERRWAALLTRIVAAVQIDSRPSRPHLPSRMSYLDASAMDREMHRL